MLSAEELEKRALDTLARLHEEHAEYKELSLKQATAENTARYQRALAYLAASGPVAERDAKADVNSRDPQDLANILKARMRATSSFLETLRGELSVYQSLMKELRTEWEMNR